MILEWEKQPLTRTLARAIRAATRRSRPKIEGHGFNYNDLKELWSAEDVHVVCTHSTDPVWQRWFYSPDSLTWELRSIHDTRKKAMDASLQDTVSAIVLPPGSACVYAWMEGSSRKITIPCGTVDRAREQERMFQRMGYEAEVKEVV